jgi:molecular chaperone GrpE
MCPKSQERDVDDRKEDSWIRKVAELEALLKDKNEREETYLNQLKYARADLENLQKNTQRRISEDVTKEKVRLIRQILSVAEELDLAVEEVRKVGEINLLEAMEMVRRKLWNFLHNEGICPIESLGKTFNPDLHEAVLEIETPDYPAGTILEEVNKGYLIKEKLLRPSMVKVASKPVTHNKGGLND